MGTAGIYGCVTRKYRAFTVVVVLAPPSLTPLISPGWGWEAGGVSSF